RVHRSGPQVDRGALAARAGGTAYHAPVQIHRQVAPPRQLPVESEAGIQAQDVEQPHVGGHLHRDVQGVHVDQEASTAVHRDHRGVTVGGGAHRDVALEV